MRILGTLAIAAVLVTTRGWAADDAALAAKLATLPPAAATPINFTRDIQPIFAAHCVECHGAETHKGGLRLDHASGLKLGGDSGAAVVAGDAVGSHLFRLVAGLDEAGTMPPKGPPLSSEQLGILRAWIEQGAKLPAEADALAPAPVKSDHWAFQPVQRPVPPYTRDTAWIRQPLDAFVLARLEAEGVAPSPEAAKATLLRRLYLDLVGLLPTPDETEAFLADTRPEAYDELVDRLLASPHHGERWARHWLDLARYADSDGYEKDTGRPYAYRYRDWVIDAINRDLSYDQFVIKQLAGDLLPTPTLDDLLATGFHRNTLTNKEGGVDQEEFRVAQVVDRTNTTGQVFMGLTVGCAQCHTHKYDPISQREYYQLFAFFNTGMERDVPAATEAEQAAYVEAKATFDRELAEVDRKIAARSEQIAPGLAAWEATQDPADIAWVPLTPSSYRTGSGPFLSLEPDASLFASGVAYESDSYVVEVETRLKDITGFRIEALPDERLPNQGPGRAGDGNFVLTGITINQSPIYHGPKTENLARYATASSPDDLEKDGGALGDKGAIDGSEDTFWDEVDNQPRYVFQAEFAEPRRIAGISLSGYKHHDFAPKDFDVVVDGQVVATVKEAVYDDNFFALGFPSVEGKQLQLVITGYYGNSPAIRELGIFDATDAVIRGQRRRSTPVALAEAQADYAQPGYAPAGAIDTEGKSGWAVGGVPAGQPHALRFSTVEDLGSAQGLRLQFILNQSFGGQHLLGRFRISATTDPRARQALPDAVRAALQTPEVYRKAPEKQAVLAYYGRQADVETQTLVGQRDALMNRMPTPPRTLAQAIVANPNPPETHIHIRGDFLQKGDVVQAATLAVLPAMQPRGERPDRLDLAQWLVSPQHPLTARVAVNRVWEKLFGAGLVRTPEEWGTRGDKPTHPELLDWLASEYVARGWSTKQLIRMMVTSATYRQSSHLRVDMLDRDPANTLLYRQNTFRVEGEITRDLFLDASGLLYDIVGGPSVRPPLPPGITDLSYASSVTWQPSTGRDVYRRGMYIWFQRTIAFPQLMAFDCPDSNVSTIKRNRSNSPLQALTLLNDPAFVECAQQLARAMLSEGGTTTDERLRYAMKRCLSRAPLDAELALLQQLLSQQLAFYSDKVELATKFAGASAEAATSPAEAAAYTVVARAIMNLDEFVTRE